MGISFLIRKRVDFIVCAVILTQLLRARPEPTGHRPQSRPHHQANPQGTRRGTLVLTRGPDDRYLAALGTEPSGFAGAGAGMTVRPGPMS